MHSFPAIPALLLLDCVLPAAAEASLQRLVLGCLYTHVVHTFAACISDTGKDSAM